jgi:hypothetical protein
VELLLSFACSLFFLAPLAFLVSWAVYAALRHAKPRVRFLVTAAALAAFLPVPVPAAHSLIAQPIALCVHVEPLIYGPLYLFFAGLVWWWLTARSKPDRRG